MKKTPITIAHGDGIGPEIMAVTLKILEAAGAQLEYETIEIGEKIYLKGNSSGIEESSWASLRRTKVFLKAPITTPQGGGFKSLNVTTRKTLGLYANVRPCVAYHPFVETKHPAMDCVIVRENEEDLYAGIEYRQTLNAYESVKLITRPGSEKIVRYAFEYARRNNRKKVTCFTKDNIMKMSDGLSTRSSTKSLPSTRTSSTNIGLWTSVPQNSPILPKLLTCSSCRTFTATSSPTSLPRLLAPSASPAPPTSARTSPCSKPSTVRRPAARARTSPIRRAFSSAPS